MVKSQIKKKIEALYLWWLYWETIIQNHLYPYDHSSITHKGKNIKSTQMLINRYQDNKGMLNLKNTYNQLKKMKLGLKRKCRTRHLPYLVNLYFSHIHVIPLCTVSRISLNILVLKNHFVPFHTHKKDEITALKTKGTELKVIKRTIRKLHWGP